MLRFFILTAARFGEVAGMVEVAEVVGDTWTVPVRRMKADRPHIVPLTAAAMACLPVPRVCELDPGSLDYPHWRQGPKGPRARFLDFFYHRHPTLAAPFLGG